MSETFYLAVCHDCTPVLPQPFSDRGERDTWATAHAAATDHAVTLKVETRQQRLTDRVWEYAHESGQDADTVRIKLLTVISLASPEVVDAAFAELRAQGAVRG